MAVLDEIDCTILAELQERGDIPNLELARLTGLSPAATSRRVARLRFEGVIEAVRAVVVPEEVGLPIEAFVLVTLAGHAPDAEIRFAREVATMPAVLRADGVAGAEDALLQVAVATPGDLQRLLLALKRAGAAQLTTMLRLQTIKPAAPLAVRAS
ncbi:Lrp/AsnC family transcriptional regulator [Solirubrobacter ginsenosidimutans]|uniref:Lrp/AsnC family transcriptional regulator n=1 Tax=Solirubrobacter ginsenosidimutans TaxID=490573 RepID=A0A9X3S4E4_9ACTN|nr:Lrp/AsnC family transcriptional regulator [Solirubrobacter ginsenosidimutans]MDA0162991.1 Lrp/AsnC family transcriptional regulator [Solirubrobacter ginsenosidimutans]